MNAIITRDGTDYNMSVIFDRHEGQYYLQFASIVNNKGASYLCASFNDARDRFINNFRFYTGYDVPDGMVPLNEEAFFGLPEGTLGPMKRRVRKAKGVRA